MSNQNRFQSVLALALLLLALSALLVGSAHAQPAKGKFTKKGGAARAEPQWVTPPVQAENLQQGTFDSQAAGCEVSNERL